MTKWDHTAVNDYFKKVNPYLLKEKGEMFLLSQHLMPDELLIYGLSGFLEKIHTQNVNGSGLMILTSKRLLFIRKSFFGAVTKEEISISKISGVSYRKGVVFNSSIFVTTSNNEASITHVDNYQAEQMSKLITRQINKNNEPNPPTPTVVHQSTAIDKYDQLSKIAELHNTGILSKEEFESEKAKILNL